MKTKKDTKPIKVCVCGGPTARVVSDLMAGLITDPAVIVGTPDEANMLLFDSLPELEQHNNEDKVGVLVWTGSVDDYRLPKNVIVIQVFEIVSEVKRAIATTQARLRGDAQVIPVKSAPTKSDALRILVIDDDPSNVRSAQELLAGHKLVVAENCEDALSALKANAFDVVLSDLRLPVSSRKLELFSYGIVVMIEAAKQGVKRIVIYTDTAHHPDLLGSALVNQYPNGTPIGIEKSTVKILASRSTEGVFGKDWSHALSEAMK